MTLQFFHVRNTTENSDFTEEQKKNRNIEKIKEI